MRKKIWILWMLLLVLLFFLTIITGEQVLLGQSTNQLPVGASVSGEVTNRLGEEWSFRGCSGDVITVTMQSTEFPTLLELYGPTGRDSLTEANSNESDESSDIESFTLIDSGDYTVIAAGASIRDRGNYSITLAISDTAEISDSINSVLIDAGMSVTGTVQNRLGDEWFFRGCAQERTTITMHSDDFDPFLALYGPTGRDALVDTSEENDANTTQVKAFPLGQNGIHTIIAAGQSIRDRGSYTLTMRVDDSSTPVITATKVSASKASKATKTPSAINTSAANATVTKISTRRATATPSDAALPTARPTSTPLVRLCRVVSNSLNLRPGPGTNYEPVLGLLPNDAELIMQARNTPNTWIQVTVANSNQVGWVSAAAQYVNCSVSIAILPVGLIPPTPTVRPTPTALPTATPTFTPPSTATATYFPSATSLPTATATYFPSATPLPTVVTLPTATTPPRLNQDAVLIPAPPGDFGDLKGDLYTTASNYFFTNFLYFDLDIRDLNAGNNVGDGIDRVEFKISCPNGGTYRRTERAARYCSFGGGEPNCNVIDLRANESFPDSNCRIENGKYNIKITAFPHNNNRDRGNWDFDFTVDVGHGSSGSGDTNQQQDLIASIVQIGSNSTNTTVRDSIVFQVAAFAPNRGNRDGDGIRNIDMWIEGPSGQRVYGRTENNVAYCAFAGGEPNCNVFDLSSNGNWPDGGPQIQNGPHRLRAIIYAEDGRSTEVSQSIEIVR